MFLFEKINKAKCAERGQPVSERDPGLRCVQPAQVGCGDL